jgi:XTP/dITP diphosphohydrolase
VPEVDDGLSKDARNNQKLVNDLRNIADKRAYFYCVLVLVRHANDPQPLIVDGVWWGEVKDEPRGGGGFGYDPHFYVASLGRCAAELDKAEKNRISHRGQAVVRLLERLRDEV